MTGQSRESLMALISKSMRTLIILSFASGAGLLVSASGDPSSRLHLTDVIADFRNDITWIVTNDDQDIFKQIDGNLGTMNMVLSQINNINTINEEQADTKARAMFLSGLGQAGPAMVGGSLVLLNEIAWWIGLMLSPIFILALLFDTTKSWFWGWVQIMLGLCFSLAIIGVMTKICVDMSVAYGASVLATQFLDLFDLTSKGPSLMGIALQQCGLGLLLTTLLVSVPTIAGSYFRAAVTGGGSQAQFAGGIFGGQATPDNKNNQQNNTQNQQTNSDKKTTDETKPNNQLQRDAATGGSTGLAYTKGAAPTDTAASQEIRSQSQVGLASKTPNKTNS